MAILSDKWIRDKAQNEGMIEPFVEAQRREGVISYGLSSYGYDARALPRLNKGETEVVFADQDRIEAITPIDRSAGIYLYNARNTSTLSFNNFQLASDIMTQYRELTQRARALQLRFNLALFFVSLALVGFAVWFALRFADRQVEALTERFLEFEHQNASEVPVAKPPHW